MRIAPWLLSLCCVFTVQAEDKVLNIYNWTDYIPVQALKDFEKETGIKVKYDLFESSEVLDSKLMVGHSGYDVVFPSSSGLARAIQAKALQPVEHGQLSNYANLDRDVLGKLSNADPDNHYGVPYTWGTIGLAINKEAVAKRIPDAPLNSLDLLFKPEYASKLKDCGVTVLDSPQEVISIALNYLGHDPYSYSDADLQEVQQLLASLQPNLSYIGGGRQLADLATGEICLSLTYNGEASIAAARAVEAKQPFEVIYRAPHEGTLMWIDSMAIPVDAPHPQAARAFIDYMLRPASSAELTNTLFFATANTAATPLLAPAVSSDLSIYPSQEVRARLFSEKTMSLQGERKRTRIWTTFRSHY